MNRPFVHQIVREVGQGALASLIGVSVHSIRYAKTTGIFPSSWYPSVLRLASERGLECPLSAFNWKPVLRAGAAPTEGPQ